MQNLIAIESIVPNPEQPRTIFDDTEIGLLAQSIAANGLVQPIVVEQAGDGYILVDGERRWRACRSLNWTEIEAVVRPISNHNGQERLAQALVANIQRANMGPVDEGRAYQKLIEKMGGVQQVANQVGISNVTIYARIQLLKFDLEIQQLFNRGLLPSDIKVTSALIALPPEERSHVAVTAASRHISGQAVIALCTRAMHSLNIQKKTIAPRRKVELAKGEHFNALSLVGEAHAIPAALAETACTTCKECDLYDMAGPSTCRQCPLVDFLRRI